MRGTLVRMRMCVVHLGALIQVADRTRALAHRQQHRNRDNNRRATRTRVWDTRHSRTITTISRSSLPLNPLRRPMRTSCPCGAPRTSHPARLRPSLHRRRHRRPSERAHHILHPCRLALRRLWLPPLLYLLLLPLHQQHCHVQHHKRPLRASLIRGRGCRRPVSSGNLQDFRVQGLVVHATGNEIWVHFWRIGVMPEKASGFRVLSFNIDTPGLLAV